MPTIIDQICKHHLDGSSLWTGDFKIPWDDPEFGRRMLNEHLSQDHQLASRKQEFLVRQVDWIDVHTRSDQPRKLIDLGCGPGLYASLFAERGFSYHGIDISPASIEYARSTFAEAGTFNAGDVRDIEFGSGYDVVSFIYGEFNVFAERDERLILNKAFKALAPGGHLLLEVQNYETVKGIGEAPASWYRSGDGPQGLFSDKPHIVLLENHWIEEEATAVQEFYVLEEAESDPLIYRNTTRGIQDQELVRMLKDCGFADIDFPTNWPVPDEALRLVVARKPG